MAEAVGVASAALTFLSAGISVFSAAKQVYKALDGQTEEDKILADFVDAVHSYSERLSTIVRGASVSPEEAEIYSVAIKCSDLARELRLSISKRHTKSKSLPTVLVAACKAVWKAGDEEKALKRLKEYHALVFMLRATCSQRETLQKLEDLEALGQSDSNKAEELRDNLNRQRTDLEACSLNIGAILAILRRLDKSPELIMKSRQLAVLDQLKKEASDRVYQTLGVHPKTLEWLLDDSQDASWQRLDARARLKKWMMEEHGLFYISGKPGAGKSTLMKFIHRHRETATRLETWAATNEKELCVGKFFFYQPGTDLENSLSALLATLLHVMLSTRPDLIPVVFPQKWEESETRLDYRVCAFGSDEIEEGFTLLVQNQEACKSHMFAFFIDGLDEFVPSGVQSYSTVAEHLVSWASSWRESLKICLSSRPEQVFLAPFEANPQFRVQDLNRDDMIIVIRKRLLKVRHFVEIIGDSEDDQERLFSVIADASEGVFLWLGLMLRQLEDGLFGNDSKEALIANIATYPRQLNDFFRKILDRVIDRDGRYVVRSLDFVISAIRETYCSVGGVTAEYAWGFDVCEGGSDAAREAFLRMVLRRNLSQEQRDSLQKSATEAQDRMSHRCKGLLETVRNGVEAPRTKLIHRSLREFLESDEGESIRRRYLSEHDWRMAFCYGSLVDKCPREGWGCQQMSYFVVFQDMVTFVLHQLGRADRAPDWQGGTDHAPDWLVDLFQKADQVLNEDCNAKLGGTSRCPQVAADNDGVLSMRWGSQSCEQRGHIAIDLLAGALGLHEYLEKLYRENPTILDDIPRLAATAKCILRLPAIFETTSNWYEEFRLQGDDNLCLPRCLKALEVVLQRGCGPLIESNYDYPDLSRRVTSGKLIDCWDRRIFEGSPWDMILTNIIARDGANVVKSVLDLVVGRTDFNPDFRLFLIIAPHHGGFGDYTNLSWFEWPSSFRSRGSAGVGSAMNDDHRPGMVVGRAMALNWRGETDLMTSIVRAGHNVPIIREGSCAGYAILSMRELLDLRKPRVNDSTKARIDALLQGISASDYQPVGRPKPGNGGPCPLIQVSQWEDGAWKFLY